MREQGGFQSEDVSPLASAGHIRLVLDMDTERLSFRRSDQA